VKSVAEWKWTTIRKRLVLSWLCFIIFISLIKLHAYNVPWPLFGYLALAISSLLRQPFGGSWSRSPKFLRPFLVGAIVVLVLICLSQVASDVPSWFMPLAGVVFGIFALPCLGWLIYSDYQLFREAPSTTAPDSSQPLH